MKVSQSRLTISAEGLVVAVDAAAAAAAAEAGGSFDGILGTASRESGGCGGCGLQQQILLLLHLLLEQHFCIINNRV